MLFIQVKALAGLNFIRAADVMAVQFTDRERCTVVLTGGVTLPCVEPASVVAARVEEAMDAAAAAKAAAQPEKQ